MRPTLLLLLLASLPACAPPDDDAVRVSFETVVVADSADLWWARVPVDLNGDSLLDVALIDDNGHGGRLGWLEASDSGRTWKAHVIAAAAPNGEPFAGGDLEAGDVDGDGDPDVIAFAHPGEWDDAGAPTTIYWYENAYFWRPHEIGEAPDFVKDVSLADFDGDGKLDVATITYETNTLSIFRQGTPTAWTLVHESQVENLHEGMAAGDIDGDGDIDLAVNGYWAENPGGDLTGSWTIRSIHERWHNQSGDWSKNATKVAAADITGDGRAEVFISHSERADYPLAWYESDDPRSTGWTEHVIVEDWPAAQTLEVGDVDGDGDLDILSGVNRTRAQDIDVTTFPVALFLSSGVRRGHPAGWTHVDVSDDGIYNGHLGDLEGDGDLDIFRLPAHDAARFEVLVNQAR